MKSCAVRTLLVIGCLAVPASAPALQVETAANTAVVQAEPAGPPPVAVEIAMVTPKPQAGRPVEIAVRTRAQAGVTLSGPAYPQPLGEWVILKAAQGKTKNQRGTRTREDRLTLLTYSQGDVPVPSLTARFRSADGQTGEYRSAPLPVQVQPPPVPGANLPKFLHDLKRPVGFFPLWLVVVGALLLGAGLAGGLWYFRRKQRLAEGQESRPSLPPDVLARQRLETLRARNYPASGEFKIFYSELSDILRRYVEGRFRVQAMDRTTLELMRNLKSTDLQRPESAVLREVLERSDMVKFAKFRPGEKEADLDWRSADDWIVRTTPVPAVPGNETSAPEPGPGGATPLQKGGRP